jgi:hypothetical protein
MKMKRNIYFLSLWVGLLLPAWSIAQQPVQRCDSFIQIFSKSDYNADEIPCDTFVVIARGLYQKVSLGYNLRGDIVAGQGRVIDNLAYQVQLSKERNDTLQKIIDLTQGTLDKYRGLTDQLQLNLDRSLKLNETVIDSTHLILKELRKDHVREVRKTKWTFGVLGAALGALAGFVAALIFIN